MANFEEMTKTLIQTQVLQALKNAPEYLDELVKAAVNKEVDEHGQTPKYHSRSKTPFLEWCVNNEIQNAARKAVMESLQEMEPQIKESVKKALSSDEIANVFVKRIVEDLVEYKVEVNIQPLKRDY